MAMMQKRHGHKIEKDFIFNNKKDLRNLMLQYGDTSVPFQKSSPSIGLKELFYDSVNDVLVQVPVSIQV